MASGVRRIFVVFFLFILTAAPAVAFYTLENVTTSPPDAVVRAGDPLRLTASAGIIPQGSTTYLEGYTLVLSTELEQPFWEVYVMVDGRKAAVFQKTSPTVFISGYLLSYPTTKDVEVRIILDGIAPVREKGSSFIVLKAIELNNQGVPVPKSVQTATGTIVHPSPVPTQTLTFQTTMMTPPGPTRSGIDFAPLIGFLGIALVFIAGRKWK